MMLMMVMVLTMMIMIRLGPEEKRGGGSWKMRMFKRGVSGQQ